VARNPSNRNEKPRQESLGAVAPLREILGVIRATVSKRLTKTAASVKTCPFPKSLQKSSFPIRGHALNPEPQTLKIVPVHHSSFRSHPSAFHLPLPTMKKVAQPQFPIVPRFTLSTATSTPVAHLDFTRKTGSIFTIFNNTRDLQKVRAKSVFSTPVSFEKNRVFARTPLMELSNSANSYWVKSRLAEKSPLTQSWGAPRANT
jgi:hypothetical protein